MNNATVPWNFRLQPEAHATEPAGELCITVPELFALVG
jgi:hypothetical protein